MLDPSVAKEPVGVLKLANTLATERYNGTPLRNLEARYQRDVVIDAKDMLERYKEQ